MVVFSKKQARGEYDVSLVVQLSGHLHLFSYEWATYTCSIMDFLFMGHMGLFSWPSELFKDM
jgi:hypothetical protein